MMEDNDDEYFYWSKNSGPNPEKNKPINRVMDYKSYRMGIHYSIVKSYHVSEGNGQWSEEEQEMYDRTVLQHDLTPFIQYSLNKNRRWEIEDDMNDSMMERLMEQHEGMDVVVVERQYLREYWFYRIINMFDHLPIHTLHRLSDDGNEGMKYEIKTTKGLGQHYNHYLKSSREDSDDKVDKDGDDKECDKTVVAYNIIKAPPNYQVLLNNKYRSWGKWFYPKHISRARRTKGTYLELRYGCTGYPFDKYGDKESVDIGEEEDIVDVPSSSTRQQFYNFSDYFIDDYVFVKRSNK